MPYFLKNNGTEITDIDNIDISTYTTIAPSPLVGEVAAWSDIINDWEYTNKHPDRLLNELNVAKEILRQDLESIYTDPKMWYIKVYNNNNIEILYKHTEWINTNLSGVLLSCTELESSTINLNLYLSDNTLTAIICDIQELKNILYFSTITFSINMKAKKLEILNNINECNNISNLYNINIVQEFQSVNNVYTLSN